MRATIKDVAKLANCSITAVSFAFNGKADKISVETLQQIRAAAKTLEYQPNKLAAGLATGRSRTIGLIIPDNRNPFFGTILNYVEAFADKAGFRVISGNTDDCIQRDLAYIDALIGYCTAGLVIVRSNSGSEKERERFLERILRLSIPVVAIDRRIAGSGVPTYSVDNRLGGYLATKHLLQQGHTRIGCYAGPLYALSAQMRLEGYRNALEENGLPYREELVFEGNYQIAANDAPCRFFLDRGVTAVFAHNDMQAYGLYKYAQANGCRIPEDLSIVGFDDLDFSTILTPTLTSIRYPLETLTCDAVQDLIERINCGGTERDKGERITKYAPELVVRESVQRRQD